MTASPSVRQAPASIGVRQMALAGVAFEYELRRSTRCTLAIAVAADGRVVVTAPLDASEAQVERVIRRRREWIGRRQRDVALRPPPPAPRAWISGETHRYLGRQYRLRVTVGSPAATRLAGAHLEVVAPDAEPARVRRIVDAWYRQRAREVFGSRLAALVAAGPALSPNGVPPLLIRHTRTRWGSCSRSGRILVNADAIRLPAGCVDYVLLHELCHLREPHHGPAFWQLLALHMPDWERWRARLAAAEL